MSARYKHETRFLYGRKAPIPPNDAIEALLRLELLTQFPAWLTQKATMLGCTSSHDILKMALKEIFPNEDATRFDLVEELYSLPQKSPTTMHAFAAWLEDWVTKLVAADEISAYVEPRRAMAVLSHVGKPLQASDTLFMTEWVAIFRESGLRDDVSVENLREACLQLVVCARARARELQVDVQVERASRAVVTANTGTPAKGRGKPAMESKVCKFFLTADGCKFGDECHYKHPRTNGKCLRCGAEGHTLSLARDLRGASLTLHQSNRLKVKAVLHLHRPRPDLHLLPSPRPNLKHNQRRKVPKEEAKARRTSLPSSRPPSPLRKLEKSPLIMMTLRRRITMRSVTGMRMESMSLRRSRERHLLTTPLRRRTTLMSVLYMIWMMVNWNRWDPLRFPLDSS